jgi:GMP synthase-like glutamine amidotransferase
MTLLVLDNALDHGFYRPVEHWARLAGFEPESVYVPSGAALPEPGAHGHVIISGSEDTITRLPAWAEDEARWVAAAARAGVRILGSCWGHQLIAVAFAGPAAVRRSATPEIGWRRIEVLSDDGLLPAGSFDSFCAHLDEVVPGCHPDIRVLARSPDCALHAFRVGDLPVWGVQAHPEVEPAVGRAFLEGGAARWPEHADAYRRALEGPVMDSEIGPELVRRFLAT